MPPPERRALRRATIRTWSSPPTRAPRRFSDIANGIAAEYGFWLGDAFASGGSTGYDHKKMGITARGAWESVKRHFRELGHDIQARGLHGRRHRRHVGRRVRQRDAALARTSGSSPRSTTGTSSSTPTPTRRGASRSASGCSSCRGSSWADYDRDADLGGRRRVPAHGQVDPALGRRRARALGDRGRGADAQRADPRAPARAGRPALERRHRHLREGQHGDARRRRRQGQRRASASTPTSCAAGSSARAATSASPSAARDRVRARAAAAINTDAIDNSAGVDCSDHEVNIKILLDAVVADGRPDRQAAQRAAGRDDRRRRRARARATTTRRPRRSSLAEAQAPAMLDVHARLIRSLEQTRRPRPRARGAARATR